MSDLARGTLINLLSRIAAVACGLVITLITARLGTEPQGQFALFVAVESVLLAACSGLGIALARRVSHLGQSSAGLVSATVLACAGLGGVLGLALWLGTRWLGGAYAPLWLLACVLPLALITPNLTGLWLGQGRMGPIAVVTVSAPLLTLLGISGAVLAGTPFSVMTVLTAWVLARLLVSVASVAAATRSGWAAPDWKVLQTDLRFVLIVGGANLIGLMNYKVDLFLVEFFLGVSSTGVYSIAVMVAELLWFLSASVSQAAFARIGTPDRVQSGATVVRVLHLSLLALLLCVPVLYGLAAWLLPLLLGDGYRAALPLLGLLLPGVLAFAAASALSAYFTNHAGKPWVPAAMALASLLINVALSLWLIPLIGMAGGAVATSVSYILTIMLMFSLFRSHAGLTWRTVLWPDARQLRSDLQSLRRLWAFRGTQP